MNRAKAKLMRARRKRGRCHCSGPEHSNCEVTQEIRQPATRHMDHRDYEKDLAEAEREMEDTYMDEPV